MKTCPPWALAKPRTVGGALVLLGLLSGCDRRHPLGPSLENFASVTAGDHHTCGLATGGAAFCWGLNSVGQLGTGSAVGPEACAAKTALPCSQEPVAVAGAITFSELSAGGNYTCGLTASGAAHCWGLLAQLYPYSSFPVAVARGFTFFAVSVGNSHACGVTTGGLLYCWGSNANGQLGNGSTSDSPVPVPVTSGLTFSAVRAGDATTEGGHTCGLITGGDPIRLLHGLHCLAPKHAQSSYPLRCRPGSRSAGGGAPGVGPSVTIPDPRERTSHGPTRANREH